MGNLPVVQSLADSPAEKFLYKFLTRDLYRLHIDFSTEVVTSYYKYIVYHVCLFEAGQSSNVRVVEPCFDGRESKGSRSVCTPS